MLPMAMLIQNFLLDCIFKVRIDISLSNLLSKECVPQVSVLSCIFFAFAINELPKCIPASVESSLYGDDFAIFNTSPNLQSAERRLQLAINAVSQ